MKHFLQILLLFTFTPIIFATETFKNVNEKDEKLQEMELKGKEFHNNLILNMERFCTKGSNKACESKKKWLEFKNNPKKQQAIDPETKKSFEDGLKLSQKCNNDSICMKKALSEQFTKQSEEFISKCAAGDQDSCFAQEQSKLIFEWGIYSMESLEIIKK